MLLIIDVGNCKLGNEGVKYLGKGKWSILEQLYIGRIELV
jgi:hypothetical protein